VHPEVVSDDVAVDRKLRGSSGEHLVCGVLAQFNWAAALTREGVARTDVLAVNTDTGRTVTIQVKTTWREKKPKTVRPVGWRLGMKDILPAAAPTEWYVMVKLEGDAPAATSYFVVPRDHVAAAAWIVHRNWQTDPNAKPGTRNTSQAQAVVNEKVFADYKDRWDLLGTATDEIPVLLPTWCKKQCKLSRVGLPPDHPWSNQLPATGNWKNVYWHASRRPIEDLFVLPAAELTDPKPWADPETLRRAEEMGTYRSDRVFVVDAGAWQHDVH